MLAWIESSMTARVYLTAGVLSTAMLILTLALAWRASRRWPAWAIACWGGLSLGSWTGLSARNDWEMPAVVSLGVAMVAGVIGLLLIRVTPRVICSLQHRRQQRRAEQAVGQMGSVYKTIDSQTQTGQVDIPSLGVFEARSEKSQPLPAFCSIRVIGMDDPGVLIVEPVVDSQQDQGESRSIVQASP